MTLWDNIIRSTLVPVMPWPIAAAEAGLRISLSCGIDIEIIETGVVQSAAGGGTTSPRVVLILALQLRWILGFYTQ